MHSMHYCKKCILPSTRPNLVIHEDGVCNACKSFRVKPHINRERDFLNVVKSAQEASNTWDCVIPVSGGKDSTWQVIKAIEYGLKPLCVTWKTPARTELGQKNLNNLISLGVDHIDFSVNPKIEKEFTLHAFKEKGSSAIPMHFALFSIPLKIATQFSIPLVIWGENSAVEYGGTNCLGSDMSSEWLLKYGVTQGSIIEDWVSKNLSRKDLSAYVWPTDEELKKSGVRAIFLGHYFNWDPENTFKIAKYHGFQELSGKAITGIYNYADIDDSFIISIHHWLKWYKFGFTRAWDNLSIEIRNGRISRSQALKTLKEIGNQEPKKEIMKFTEWAGISFQEFNNIIEKFRNRNIWYQENGMWKIKGFIFNDWKWN